MIYGGLGMEFIIKENENHQLESIVNKNDKYKMNWVATGKKWGEMFLPDGITGRIERTASTEGKITEKYIFVNNRNWEYFPQKGEIGIAVPFPDNYTAAEICMRERCHAHIRCGESQSYIAGIRMGGEKPNLGLVLKKGKIEDYSIIRNEKELSNDRGTIILNPKINNLKPGERTVIQWDLFWYDSQREFEEKLLHQEGQLLIQLEHGIYFEGEDLCFHIKADEEIWREKEIEVTLAGEKISAEKTENGNCIDYKVKMDSVSQGEQEFLIKCKEYSTSAIILVLPKIEKLAEKRCRFIVEKQQYFCSGSLLDGAFLTYDNEDKRLVYEKEYDHNGGRERVGMGALLALWLQKNKDMKVEKALQKYTEYIYRELYDENTGIVYNDAGRDNTWNRLYNYPWLAIFFMERYRLYNEVTDLKNMYKIMKSYYAQDGASFYAIGIPMLESVKLLKSGGMEREAEELLRYYEIHGEMLIKNGLCYPPHEVKYEQSIVAPAVNYLFQLYELTGKILYLEEGKKQLAVLVLFNGHQPDFHMYENAVRHWDGYWFGKYKNLGDTFPHYWSSLSGVAFREYEKITGERSYGVKAENSLRGVLSMINSDGSASCAYVYPFMVNNVRCQYADPWANDQDWALYYYLKEGKNYD